MSEKKLLMIDDDPNFVEGIKSILDSACYDFDVAYNPDDGFRALERGSYDLLLLDIMMGRGGEGIMIARKICKDPVLREPPMLITTGIGNRSPSSSRVRPFKRGSSPLMCLSRRRSSPIC